MADVRVPVSANVTPVVSAIDEIRRATRGAAKDNRQLSDDLKKVNAQFDLLQKINKPLGDRLKQTGQAGKSISDVDWGRLYGSKSGAEKARKAAVEYATSGTSFSPVGGVGAGSGSGSGSGAGLTAVGVAYQGGRRLLRYIPGAGAALTLAGGAAGAYKSEQTAKQQAISLDALMRSSGGLKTTFDSFRDTVRRTGQDFNITSTEAIRLHSQYSKASGKGDLEGVRSGVNLSTGLSRNLGIDSSSIANALGRYAWLTDRRQEVDSNPYLQKKEQEVFPKPEETNNKLVENRPDESWFGIIKETLKIWARSDDDNNARFQRSKLPENAATESIQRDREKIEKAPRTDPQNQNQASLAASDRSSQKEFAVLLAEAIASSGMWTKSDQVVNSILSYVESASVRAGDASHVKDFADFKVKMDLSDFAGMRGREGDRVLSNIDNVIESGGGSDEASRLFMARAANRDNNSYYKFLYGLERGAFASASDSFPGGDERSYIELAMSQLKKDHPHDKYRRFRAMGGMFPGMNQHQAEAFEKVYERPKALNSLVDMLKKNGYEISDVRQGTIQPLANLASARTHKSLMEARDEYLETNKNTLTDRQRTRLKGGSDEEIRKSLAGLILRRKKLSSTPGSDAQSADVTRERENTELVGNTLLPAVTAFSESIGDFQGWMNRVGSLIERAEKLQDARSYLRNQVQGGSTYPGPAEPN